jgi:hypothetical protein
MLAGHETTSNTIGWILYALAQNPDVQRKLRHEICKLKEGLSARGQVEATARDMDGMPYLIAVVKASGFDSTSSFVIDISNEGGNTHVSYRSRDSSDSSPKRRPSPLRSYCSCVRGVAVRVTYSKGTYNIHVHCWI